MDGRKARDLSDEILRRGKCKRAPSDAPFIISVSRSVAILQFISVSVYPRGPDTRSYYPISRGNPPGRTYYRNKWKDAVFEPAERLEEKSVSAFQYSQVVPRAFCPRITSPSSGLFSSAVPLSTEIRKRQDLFRRKVIRVIKLISRDPH